MAPLGLSGTLIQRCFRAPIGRNPHQRFLRVLRASGLAGCLPVLRPVQHWFVDQQAQTNTKNAGNASGLQTKKSKKRQTG
jgi:hypothetical protein